MTFTGVLRIVETTDVVLDYIGSVWCRQHSFHHGQDPLVQKIVQITNVYDDGF